MYSDFEWLSGEGPAIRFGHRAVEVVDEIQQSLTQSFQRWKVASLQHSTHNDTEPDLDLHSSWLNQVDTEPDLDLIQP